MATVNLMMRLLLLNFQMPYLDFWSMTRSKAYSHGSNRPEAHHTQTQLNQAFGNANRVNRWSNSWSTLLHGHINDHVVLYITLIEHEWGTKSFQFLSQLTQPPIFQQCILEGVGNNGYGLANVHPTTKIIHIKKTIRGWASTKGNPTPKSKAIAVELHKMTTDLVTNAHNPILDARCNDLKAILKRTMKLSTPSKERTSIGSS